MAMCQAKEEMTAADPVLFWFFLVVGPLQMGTPAHADFHQAETRQTCWMEHARELAGKDDAWLRTHLVTPCAPHPAVQTPPDADASR